MRAGLVLSVAACLRAQAEVNTLVEWQVSPDNIVWTSSLRAMPADFVFVRARVSYIGSTPPFALASFLFQPTVSNWDLAGSEIDTLSPFVNNGMGSNTSTPIGVITDTTDPAQFGRVFPFGRSALTSTSYLKGHLHTDGSAGSPAGQWLRVAQAQVTSWIGGQGNTTGGSGVPISQLNLLCRCTDPAPYQETQHVTVFKFGINLSHDTQPRLLRIDSPTSGFGNRNSTTGEREVFWYAFWGEGTGSIRGTPVISTATIRIGQCSGPDFNHDGNPGTDADIEAFFACLAGSCCASCDSADIDADGDTGTDADIEAFFRVLAGGTC
jgi:hypothetical protein